MELMAALLVVVSALLFVWLILCHIENDWLMPPSWRFHLTMARWRRKAGVKGKWEIDVATWPTTEHGYPETQYRLTIVPPADYKGFDLLEESNYLFHTNAKVVEATVLDKAMDIVEKHISQQMRSSSAKTIRF